MDKAERERRCEALVEAIATEHASLRTRWVRCLLERLEAADVEDYEALLREIRAEIDARLVLGEW
jgi:hypothetical protein